MVHIELTAVSMTPKARLHELAGEYARISKLADKAMNVLPDEGGFRRQVQVHAKELRMWAAMLREWALSADGTGIKEPTR